MRLGSLDEPEQHAPLSYSEPASICGDVSFVQRPKTATSCLAPCSMRVPWNRCLVLKLLDEAALDYIPSE